MRTPRVLFVPLVGAIASLPTSSAWAQPAVTAVSGTFTHGSTVSVNGSGFGSKPSSSPYKWDTFNGVEGTSMEADARGWIVSDNDPKPTLSSAVVRPTPGRTTCVSFDTIDDAVPALGFGDNASGWLNLTAGSAANQSTPPQRLLVDYWMYFEQATVSNNYKLLRWHGMNEPAVNNRFWGAPGGTGATDCNFSNFYFCSGPANWDDGGWHHIQILYTWSTAQSENHVRFYYDGAVMMDSDGAGNYVSASGCAVTTGPWAALTPGDSLGTFIWELQDGTDGSPSRDSSMVLCDALVDDGYNRFEIGNAPTYAASTHRETQPYTAWADGQVALTLNRGTFGATESAYLFVIDENDVASAGYPLTFGDEEEPVPGGGGAGGSNGSSGSAASGGSSASGSSGDPADPSGSTDSSGGCSCAAPSSTRDDGLPLLLGFLGLLGLGARPRRRARPRASVERVTCAICPGTRRRQR